MCSTPKDVCFATRIGYLWTLLKIFMHSAQYIYEAPHMFMYTDKSGLHVKHPRYLCLQIQDIHCNALNAYEFDTYSILSVYTAHMPTTFF